MQTDERLTNPDAPLWDTPEGRAVSFFLNPNWGSRHFCLRCGQKATVGGKGWLRGMPFCGDGCKEIFTADFKFTVDLFARGKASKATAVEVVKKLLS